MTLWELPRNLSWNDAESTKEITQSIVLQIICKEVKANIWIIFYIFKWKYSQNTSTLKSDFTFLCEN